MTETDNRLKQFATSFVESTRDYIFIRPEDNILILRPNKVHFLNETATIMLKKLYDAQPLDVMQVVEELATHYKVPSERIEEDMEKLLVSLSRLLQGQTCGPAVRHSPFGSHERKYPILSEIALTYRCQNRCFFCYASSPERGRQVPEMTTEEVCLVIDKIVDQARVPSISFTGGEPTLRDDLPELVAHAKGKGMRVNLISNGIRCAEESYVSWLAEAGLDSAQISLEAGRAEVHDAVVNHPGAFSKTVQGVRNLKSAGIHTHTNTTINRTNRQDLFNLIDLLAEMGQEYLSMNMVIRTGEAVGKPEVGYDEIGELVAALKERAEGYGMRFVWYSPVPYCLFNPIQHGLGSQACSAADGLLSIAPDGAVLPCSSFEEGIGNLLHEDFETLWNRRTALYWRNKEFLPPGCKTCDLAKICCGACPLYWDEKGAFNEIAPYIAPTPAWQSLIWRLKRRYVGRVKGVGVR
ncbi:MAG: PqqD family peptide modification chaperone [Anaerolineae bacterium]